MTITNGEMLSHAELAKRDTWCEVINTPIYYDKETFRVRDSKGESLFSVFIHHTESEEMREKRANVIVELVNLHVKQPLESASADVHFSSASSKEAVSK